MLVISYEELRSDLRACVRRVHSHCGFGLSDDRIEALLPRFTFEWMRANESQFHPRSVRWVRRDGDEDDFHFIRAGRVGDGAKTLNEAQIERLRGMLWRTFPAGDAPEAIASLVC